jgi:hypothetical protein
VFKWDGAASSYLVSSDAWIYGWTGGWYALVRDISELPDGSLLISFFEESSKTGRYAVVDAGLTATLESGQISTFAEPGPTYQEPFSMRSDSGSAGRIATFTSYSYKPYADYGIYMSVWKTTAPPLGRLRVLISKEGATLNKRWKFMSPKTGENT